MIFDKRCLAGGGCTNGGTMDMTSSGMPLGTTVSVNDEESPSATFVNGTNTWEWNKANTDGGMVSGLESSTWSIDLTINSYTHLENGFGFVSTSGKFGLTGLVAGETLTITASVPAPATGLRLILGLAGLAARKHA